MVISWVLVPNSFTYWSTLVFMQCNAVVATTQQHNNKIQHYVCCHKVTWRREHLKIATNLGMSVPSLAWPLSCKSDAPHRFWIATNLDSALGLSAFVCRNELRVCLWTLAFECYWCYWADKNFVYKACYLLNAAALKASTEPGKNSMGWTKSRGQTCWLLCCMPSQIPQQHAPGTLQMIKNYIDRSLQNLRPANQPSVRGPPSMFSQFVMLPISSDTSSIMNFNPRHISSPLHFVMIVIDIQKLNLQCSTSSC